MEYMDSSIFFCTFLETLTDVVNYLVEMDLPIPSYGMIS